MKIVKDETFFPDMYHPKDNLSIQVVSDNIGVSVVEGDVETTILISKNVAIEFSEHLDRLIGKMVDKEEIFLPESDL